MPVQAWQNVSVGGCLPRLTTHGQKTVQLQFKINSPLISHFFKKDVNTGFIYYSFYLILDIATNDPEIKSNTDKGKVTYCPIFGNFSQIITRVAKAINPMFITPPTKARSISNQQQPKQKVPIFIPTKIVSVSLLVQPLKKKLRGCRQRYRQAFFKLENW